MQKLAKNQYIKDGFLYHTKESVESLDAVPCTDKKKLEGFIRAGKIPNGTGGVYIDVDRERNKG